MPASSAKRNEGAPHSRGSARCALATVIAATMAISAAIEAGAASYISRIGSTTMAAESAPTRTAAAARPPVQATNANTDAQAARYGP